MRTSSRPILGRFVALVAVLALVAAACGGGGDDGDATQRGGGGDAPEPVGDPVTGGRLVYAVESDTTSPWTPQASQCAISCHMVMRTVFDPLAVVNADGEVVPFLASAIEHSADYRSWTITARDGVTFHDGTPFDGEAIKVNLEGHLQSPLTGTVLRDLAGLTVDGQSATVTFNDPWVWFPFVVSGQLGYMASPTWLAGVASGDLPATQPVGTGPFMFKSYEPGIQAVYVGQRNPDYWIDGLPYLDEVEFRALPNSAQRIEGVANRQIDITHTSGGADIDNARDLDVTLIENSDFGETGYLLMNPANEDSAISDVRVRRALAHALDRELITDLRQAGVKETANGPFNPTQIGYLEDTGFPDYDQDMARSLVDEYEAENGPINIVIKTTTDPQNAETIELIRSAWSDVGIDSETDEVPQNAFIAAAVTGNFEVFLWRNHGGTHPDTQNHWWHGDVATANSLLIINFGRIADDVIDENLDAIRQSDDDEVVREAAEAINRQFGEQVYNIWLWWDVWGIVADRDVQNITQMVLPDGDRIIPFGLGIGGAHWISQIWKTAS